MAGKIDAGLAKAMRDSLKAYANGDRKFFGFLSDSVRIFNVNAIEPMVGRAAFERAFKSFKTKRDVKVIHSDIQPGDERAVLAQTMRVTTDGITSNLRQTVIWERSGKDWQMTHIHNAMVGQPVASAAVIRTARDVRVLNERIATVAATVGVAQ